VKHSTLTLLALAALAAAIPAFADNINISIDESQQVWPVTEQIVTGELILCEGPAETILGPCMTAGPNGVSDVIIFNNNKHQVTFLSNNSDGTGDPADVTFAGKMLTLVNPRWVAEPVSDTLIWSPGLHDPGFYGVGNTWTITSNDAMAIPEPSSAVLLMTSIVAWCFRRATGATRRTGL
jgi:hypothetical protein